MHEWPLIFFTTLIQISIGCFLLAFFYVILTKDTSKIHFPIMASSLIAVAGLFSSIFHLGNPWHMFNTMNNVFNSWMSREVLFVGSYTGLITLNIVYFFFTNRYHKLLLSVTAVTGVCTVFVMSNIYINSLFVLWSGWVTYSSFWATTLVTGGLVACFVFNVALQKDTRNTVMIRIIRLFFIFSVLAVVLNICAYVFLQSNMAGNVSRGITPRYVDRESVLILISLKFALIVLGLIIMAFIKNKLNRRFALPAVAMSSLIAVVAEVIGRYSFFMLGA